MTTAKQKNREKALGCIRVIVNIHVRCALENVYEIVERIFSRKIGGHSAGPNKEAKLFYDAFATVKATYLNCRCSIPIGVVAHADIFTFQLLGKTNYIQHNNSV
ncbi:MAG: hypothetical protein GX254_04725 [Clostridiales bacterium]|jgi:hypothetical protein|nr:hypothetical protein [Clostridiales bacterium]